MNFYIAAALATLAAGCGDYDPESMTNMMHIEWNYTDKIGPKNWGKLSPDYTLCETGHQQSPLDLDDDVVNAGGQEFTLQYPAAGTQLVNNGHTLQTNFLAGDLLRFAQQDFQLAQFHLHAPSEHLINGVPAAMEVHLVHQSGDGKILVLAVLLQSGADSPWLDRLLSSAPASGQTTTLATGINPTELLPSSAAHYSYTGSLTTPPCTEQVQWLVMTTAGTVSPAQVAAFLAINGANARPVQQRRDRRIEKSPLT